MPDPRCPVMIAGAGPTGLVLGLSLARRGVAFRLLDEHDGPGRESRAMGVHARTLEFYRQFGFAHEVVEAGIPVRTVHLRRHGRDGREHVALSFSLDAMGEGLSPYAFLLTYPQDVHERLLIGKLADLGVTVERSTRLLGFEQDERGVRARVQGPHGTQDVAADYLAGCDGARSRVRETIGAGFAGGTYEQLFFVADVRIEGGFARDVVVNLGERSLGLMMPVRATGMQRLIGLVPDRLRSLPQVGFEDIRSDIETLADVRVAEVNWFSTYRVHHRVADRFRVGRAFLAGDAGHLHSPAGGQGMNTGIGDAINLGWKLADVLRGRADASLLDSYEPERLPFARKLVATTDRAFEAMIAGGLKGEALRTWLAPSMINIVARLPAARRAAFRTASQIAIAYDSCSLSEGRAGGVRAGERLPWVATAENFAPLASLEWQAHVYGAPAAGLAEACAALGVPLHVFPWDRAIRRAGLGRNALYLVRPDGHVALAARRGTAECIRAYLARHGLRPGVATPAGH